MKTMEATDRVQKILDEFGQTEDAEFFVMIRNRADDATGLMVQTRTGGVLEVLVTLVRMLGAGNFDRLAERAKEHAAECDRGECDVHHPQQFSNEQGEGEAPGEGGEPPWVTLPGNDKVH